MSELKTKRSQASVSDFISSIEHPIRREDSLRLLEIYQEITKDVPKMWGASIIGFGTYQYTDSKGKQHTWMRNAFSPRKQYMSLYLMRGVNKHPELLDKLGKHKHGKSCLNINKLADVNIDILKRLVQADADEMDKKYPN